MNPTLTPIKHVKVSIKGLGEVRARLLQRHLDGDIRVEHEGKEYVVTPINQIKEC